MARPHPVDWSAKLNPESLYGKLKTTKHPVVQRLPLTAHDGPQDTQDSPISHGYRHDGCASVPSSLWVLGYHLPRRRHTALSEKAHTLEHMKEKVPLTKKLPSITPAQGDSRAPLTCDLQGITIGKTRIPCKTQTWVSQKAVLVSCPIS